ncbi:MAG: protein-glutamate O-methyltransferase CheR, partial [Planctomycetes bacterium]|nr:protein-glutamate O-methyltransferase CheR [Planctomycetota bacterium]
MSDFRAETASLEADVRRLLARVHERYGADFREYAPASISRRIANCVAAEGLDSVPQLEERLLSDPECAERFVRAVTVHVTTMFRNPEFYRAFRETVVGRLRERPFIRIWHAGCSTGEEVYSLAVLLHEEGLAARCLIYATDLSEQVLETARQGIFSQTRVREFTTTYIAAGGRRSF